MDLTGEKFGRLTVIARAPDHMTTQRGIYYLCECECGKIKPIRATYLRQGRSLTCGCGRFGNNAKPPLEPGTVFGGWTVEGVDATKPRRSFCRCECGTVRSVANDVMRRGDSVSCGCRRKAQMAAARARRDWQQPAPAVAETAKPEPVSVYAARLRSKVF